MPHTTKPTERPLSALDVIFSRRSVRAYTNEPLDKATVRALLDAAVQAPTALHAEPWAFVVIQDTNILKRCSDAAKAPMHGFGPSRRDKGPSRQPALRRFR